MKLTPWFQGSNPVRPGVYERQYIYGKTPYMLYSYWNGKAWSMGEATAKQAAKNETTFDLAPSQHLPWRGVLRESNP